MAEILESGEFWLPPDFFTGDGILSDKPTSDSLNSSSISSSSSPAFSSALASTETTTDTEEEEEEVDEEDVIPLTRCFTLFTIQPNQRPAEACGWDMLYGGDVAGKEGTMKMNGPDETGLKVNRLPLRNNHCGSFYDNQFPFNQVEPKKQGQVTNQKYCSILGRPSVNVLLHRQMQLHQQMIYQHGGRVLGTNLLQENARHIHSLWNVPFFTGPYPLVERQTNNMSTATPPGTVGRKQARLGTGVFIPRPFTNPSNTPSKSVGGCYNAQHPPRFYQAVNKNSALATTQALMAPHLDTLVVRSNTIPSQKMSGLQLDGLVHHEQCLPQEWSY